MAYLSDVKSSSGEDNFAGDKIISIFCLLRLELEQRGLLEYSEEPADLLYLAINKCEEILRDLCASCAAETGIATEQWCRDCGELFPYDPDADTCPACLAA